MAAMLVEVMDACCTTAALILASTVAMAVVIDVPTITIAAATCVSIRGPTVANAAAKFDEVTLACCETELEIIVINSVRDTNELVIFNTVACNDTLSNRSRVSPSLIPAIYVMA